MNLNYCLNEEVKNVKQQMKKEELLLFIKRRNDCNRKAHEVVEELLETTNPDRFLNVLTLLNQEHINDVFEERSITKLCGYPLCNKELGPVVKHQYKISTKLNKVYDITERKKFCSRGCFAAAKYIREQLPSSPLWVNDLEEKRKYVLLNHKESTPHLGDEVLFGLSKLKIPDDEDINLDNSQTIRCENGQELAQNKASEDNNDKELIKRHLDKPLIEKSVTAIKVSVDEEKIVNNLNKNILNDSLSNNKVSVIETEEETKSINNEKISNNIVKNPDIKHELVTSNEVHVARKQEIRDEIRRKQRQNETEGVEIKYTPEVVVKSVIAIIKDWISLDSIKFIHGKEKLKQYVTVKTPAEESLYTDEEKNKIIEKYNNLCKKLDLLELQEHVNSVKEDRKLKPLPDYNQLKLQTHKLEVKVNAFFAGETHIPTESLDGTNVKLTEKKNTDIFTSDVTFLPLLDNTDKNTMRRKVLLNNMQPIVDKILRDCKILRLDISSDLRSLVQTFILRADNIVFKPVQMKLICHIIIYIIAIKDAILTQHLETKLAKLYYSYVIQAYQIDFTKFKDIISEITDIEEFLKNSNHAE